MTASFAPSSSATACRSTFDNSLVEVKNCFTFDSQRGAATSGWDDGRRVCSEVHLRYHVFPGGSTAVLSSSYPCCPTYTEKKTVHPPNNAEERSRWATASEAVHQCQMFKKKETKFFSSNRLKRIDAPRKNVVSKYSFLSTTVAVECGKHVHGSARGFRLW